MQKELPSWVLPLAVVVGVVVVGFIVWLRAEMNKPRPANPPGSTVDMGTRPAPTTP